MHFKPIAHTLLVPFAFSTLAALAQQMPTPIAATSDMGRIEITSERDNETQQRRESTASKIVIGREEIERQGDANLGEILKRMPGITLGGAAGTITLDQTATQTTALAIGSCVYDLELVSGANVVTRLLQGELIISAEVTR